MGYGTGTIVDPNSEEHKQYENIPANWQVRAPLVLPHEIVKVKIFKNMDTYSEGDLVEVIQPSEHRVEPKCQYAGKCGGCQFQHMHINQQREWKTDFVLRHLVEQQIDGYTTTESIKRKLFPAKGTDEIYEYRSKITPHYQAPVKLSKGRGHGDNDNDNEDDIYYDLEAIGFQQFFSRRLQDVEECPIATPAINVKYKETRVELHEKALKGELNNQNKTRKKSRSSRRRRNKNVDAGATLLFRQADNDKDGNPVIVTDPNQYMTTTIKGIKFKYQANNFFQNNDYVTPLMVEGVLDAAMAPIEGSNSTTERPTHLIDCYCGSGTFSKKNAYNKRAFSTALTSSLPISGFVRFLYS